MTKLVVVCGLEAEARIARGKAGVEAVAGGGDGARIATRLDALKPSAVISFGIAGGLSPGLAPGDGRIADAVIMPDGRCLRADTAWADALAQELEMPKGVIAGVDAPLSGAQAKAALHQATDAVLVDMESHHVADWAARHGARFAALRIVTDIAEWSLPHAAAVGMRADGSVDLPAILASLAKNPAQLPGLIRTGLDARAAFASLLRCRQRLGPRFALLDLG